MTTGNWTPRLRLVVAVATGLAIVLQACRLPFRWNQITFAYGAYYGEYLWSVELRGWATAFTTFVGIHPPAYSLLAAALIKLGASPALWHGISGLFSVAAVPTMGAAMARGLGVPLVSRSSVAVGGTVVAGTFLMASSPHRNAYGLEVNNYPLLVLVTCLQMLAFAWFAGPVGREKQPGGSASPQRKHTVLLTLATALCLWTHALAAALPLAQGLSLAAVGSRRQRLAFVGALGGVFVLCLPLLPAVLGAAGGDPINLEAGWGAALRGLLVTLPGRYGEAVLAWGVIILVGLGLRRILRLPPERRLVPLSWAMHAGVGGLLVLCLSAAGIASPWQFPYYLAPLPSLLAVAACALLPEVQSSKGSQSAQPQTTTFLVTALLVTGLVAIQTDEQLWENRDAHRLRSQAADSYGLVAEGIEAWRPGDSLLLVQFPQFLDDDKDAIDPIYSLLPLWTGFQYVDPRIEGLLPYDPNWGQPVRFSDGRWLYTLTSADPERLETITRHVLHSGKRVIVAAYSTDHSPQDSERLTEWAQGVSPIGRKGPDHMLWIFDPP